MARADVDEHFKEIDALVAEINELVPLTTAYRTVQFRADLAGLLVVAMASTYETCVKEIIYEYASKHHAAFGGFAQRNYQKLNSRVSVSDLKKYCALFDPTAEQKFKSLLTLKKAKLARFRINVETSYDQILAWRHDFAHARIRNTTIEEAVITHRRAKRVIYIFDEALCG